MRKSDWFVWKYLDKRDATSIAKENIFQDMMQKGWLCRTILWMKDKEDVVLYPNNLFEDLKKENEEVYWPDTILNIHKQGLACALSAFDDKYQLVINLRYQLGASYERIADLLEMSAEGIRQIIRRILRQLTQEPNHSLIALGLDEYINQQVSIRDAPHSVYCIDCGKKITRQIGKDKYDKNYIDRQRRIAEIDILNVQVEKMEHGYFGIIPSDTQYGVCIIVSIENISKNILDVEIDNCYIVRNGITVKADSQRLGMGISNGILIQGETRQFGLIWYQSTIPLPNKSEINDSLVVVLRVNGLSSKLVYRFDKQYGLFDTDYMFRNNELLSDVAFQEDRFMLADFTIIGSIPKNE